MKEILERIAAALEKSNEITEKYIEKMHVPMPTYQHLDIPVPECGNTGSISVFATTFEREARALNKKETDRK